MSLDYAILGFLTYQPMSGYDLKKVFDNSVRHFWTADQSQIYRTLARLTEKEWVDMEIFEQLDRPDRKVYHITPTGREELARWLKGSFPTEEAHSAPLVQVFFSGQLNDQEILAKFEEAAAFFRMILDRYQAVPGQVEEYIRRIDSPREAFFWMSTLDLGIKTMQTQLEWAEKIIAQIKNNEIPEK